MLRQNGLSLIEIMVAMVIGLIGTLAIVQVYINSEAGQRSTGSLADSQGSGMVAMYALQRDIQQAGLGFARREALGCTVTGTTKLSGAQLQPVAIIPDGAGTGSADNLWGIPPGDDGSDMIVVAYGESNTMVEGAVIRANVAANSTVFRISSLAGINALNNIDYALIVESGQSCLLAKILNADPASFDVTLDAGGSSAYTTNGYFLELGRSPQFAAFAVRKGTLTRCDFLTSDCANGDVEDPSIWVPVAGNVAAIRAQYHIDSTSPMDGFVDVSCASRVTPGTTSCTAGSVPGNTGLAQSVRACDWQRIRAVAIAVVTRSPLAEKEEVSPSTIKLWEDNAAVAPVTVGPTYTVPDRHYRYRVSYGAVPLRNIIRMDNSSSC